MKVCCQEYKDIDLSQMDQVIEDYKKVRGSLIPVLQKVQAIYGWLPEPVVGKIARELNIYMSQIYGVVTFYSQFYTAPRGEYTIRVCRGTACHVKGSERIQDNILAELDTKVDDITSDGKFTVEEVACVGACGIAPVVIIGGKTFGSLTVGTALDAVKNFNPDDLED
jgi:NADH-quinone oxidoreductase subunit E